MERKETIKARLRCSDIQLYTVGNCKCTGGYAPIKVMPHYPPIRAIAGQGGDMTINFSDIWDIP